MADDTSVPFAGTPGPPPKQNEAGEWVCVVCDTPLATRRGRPASYCPEHKPPKYRPREANVTMVEQPGGRGELKQGGNPGNRGGFGRPSSASRRDARSKWDKHLHTLDEIASDDDARDQDRIAAIREFARVGFADSLPMSEVRKNLEQTLLLIEAHTDEQTAQKLLHEIRRVWVG